MHELLFKYPKSWFAESPLAFDALLPAWALAVIAICAVALAGWSLHRVRAITGPKRWSILVCQALGIALIVSLLAQPVLIRESVALSKNEIALVIDDSTSMTVGSNANRFVQARAALNAESLGLTADTTALSLWTLSSTAPVANYDDVHPVATSTDYVTTFTKLAQRAQESPVAAIVLASDGVDTSGFAESSAERALLDTGIPVFPIAVGAERLAGDLAIVALDLPKKIRAGTPVTAQLVLRHTDTLAARLRVFAGNALISAVTLSLPSDQSTSTQTVNIPLPEPGFHTIRFDVSTEETDPDLSNNVREAVVHVSERRARVLYFEGEPRWEYKFIRRALPKDASIELVSLLRVSPNKFYRQGLASPDELADGFPDTAGELYAYDALIIGSVEAAALSNEQHRLIRDFVDQRGGSLLMLAGRRGLGDGGWRETPLDPLFPTDLPPYGSNTYTREPVQARPTLAGERSNLLGLDNDRGTWSDLPALADQQSLGRLRPGARSLLAKRSDREEEPLLVTRPYGHGQVWLFGTAGTWRWQMQLPAADQRHERFWQQLVDVLVAPTPLRADLVLSDNDGQLRIEAHAVDGTWHPIDKPGLVAELTAPDGSTSTVTLQAENQRPGHFLGLIDAPQPGNYSAEIIDEDVHREAPLRASLVAAGKRQESSRLAADHQALRRLANKTGGIMIDANEPSALAAALQERAVGLSQVERLPLWNMPVNFLLLIGIKLTEWLLRRRWGVV